MSRSIPHRKWPSIDILSLYSKSETAAWNQFLYQALKKQDVEILKKTLYGVQAGMADAVKAGLEPAREWQGSRCDLVGWRGTASSHCTQRPTSGCLGTQQPRSHKRANINWLVGCSLLSSRDIGTSWILKEGICLALQEVMDNGMLPKMTFEGLMVVKTKDSRGGNLEKIHY